MSSKIRGWVAGLTLLAGASMVPSGAAAQDCAGLDLKDPQSPAHLEVCVKKLSADLAEATRLLGELNTALTALQSASDGHIHDGAYAVQGHDHAGSHAAADHEHSGAYAVQGHDHDSHASAVHEHAELYSVMTHDHEAELPAGAVVMFAKNYSADGKNESDPCPGGWTLYQQATGRMAIGAGQPGGKLDAAFVKKFGQYEIWDAEKGEMVKTDLRPHFQDPVTKVWGFYGLEEVGGAEEVRLMEAEIPSHSHENPKNLEWVQVAGHAQGHPAITTPGRDPNTAYALSPTVRSSGDEAHNNMPPYIALYFCVKQ